VAVLKKYDLLGKEIGEVTIEETFLEKRGNAQMIKDYLVALRANARQWSANTKTRAEVNHSGQKPHPQKGSGRARQGYLGAPHYKGGGRVFSPRPKFDQHVSINKKERRAAISHLLAEKVSGGKAVVLQYSSPLAVPKTKTMAGFLDHLSLSGERVLFLAEGQHLFENYETLVRSLRNIPRVEIKLVSQISGYDVALCSSFVFLEPVLEEVKLYLQSGV